MRARLEAYKAGNYTTSICEKQRTRNFPWPQETPRCICGKSAPGDRLRIRFESKFEHYLGTFRFIARSTSVLQNHICESCSSYMFLFMINPPSHTSCTWEPGAPKILSTGWKRGLVRTELCSPRTVNLRSAAKNFLPCSNHTSPELALEASLRMSLCF